MSFGRPAGDEARLLLADDFEGDLPAGSVVGSTASNGTVRHGVDAEGIIAVDNGALRLQPLARPGWGREGVAYGPFARAPGLALAVLASNGHNASQTYYMPESRKEFVRRFVQDARKGKLRRPRHHENMAVGWFPEPVPRDPIATGNGFIMHAATADNGELWAGVAGKPDPVVLGVQNLPILYVVVLRDCGAAYYTASLQGALGVGSFPELTPLAVDTASAGQQLWAGLQQRILGEVGYRVDTRVHGVRVAEVPAWSSWYGTAQAADRLAGDGALAGSAAEAGGRWQGEGPLERSPDGTRLGAGGGTAEAVATMRLESPAGLVHAVVTAGGPGAAGLVFRASEEGSWSFTAGPAGCRLDRHTDGGSEVVATSEKWKTTAGRRHALQVLDSGEQFSAHLDGALVFDRRFDDVRGADASGSGVLASAGFAGVIHHFESHPRRVTLPDALLLEPPTVPPGTDDVFVEAFEGCPGDLVNGPGASGVAWARSEGHGVLLRSEAGGLVKATKAEPNPGRTIYTAEWPDPDYAELTLDLTHPGTARGQGEAGRGGVVFWQDADNYLVVNFFVDDTFDGASISTFYHLGGKEVMWDAVWTLVRGVTNGSRNVMETRFDGTSFVSILDGRPSLHRALTDVYPDAKPLAIRRVGIIANWEWGDDTGTVFHRFVGRTRAPAGGPAGAGPGAGTA